MASLHAAAAIAAAADRDIQMANDGPADNLFLILAAAAMRAALRQGNGDLFIHLRREWGRRPMAVALAGFATGPLRTCF